MTDLHNINSELNVILESIPFATLVEDEKGIILSVNSRFHELFEDTDAIIGKSYYDWKQQELSGKIIRFNERSGRMLLASGMRECGKDDTYRYFYRTAEM